MLKEDIQMHQKRIENQEIEKKERDVKIDELKDTLSKVMLDLSEMKSSNDDLASKLNVANDDIDQKKLQIDQLNKVLNSGSAAVYRAMMRRSGMSGQRVVELAVVFRTTIPSPRL